MFWKSTFQLIFYTDPLPTHNQMRANSSTKKWHAALLTKRKGHNAEKLFPMQKKKKRKKLIGVAACAKFTISLGMEVIQKGKYIKENAAI